MVDRQHGRQDFEDQCQEHAPKCDDEEIDPPAGLLKALNSSLPACDGQADLSAAVVRDLVLRDCTLTLGGAGSMLTFVASELSNVRIQSTGAVTLRIQDSVLEHIEWHTGSGEGEPAASLQITHSDLYSSELELASVDLTSSVVSLTRLTSQELIAVDLEAKSSVLSVRAVSIAASILRTTQVTDCSTLLMASCKLHRSRIDGCEHVSRLYDVEATECTIDGELEIDFSALADSRLGVHGFAQLHGWYTSVDNSVLCGATESIRVASSGFRCVACEGPLTAPEPDVCADTGPPTTTTTNPCPALDELPICSMFPRRPRPVSGE